MSAAAAAVPSLPVLVLQRAGGTFQHGVLGIVRTLGRLGVRVDLVHHDLRTPVAASRYCRGVVACPEEAADDVVLERLAHYAHRHAPAILIATDDESAVFVDVHAEALRAAGFLFQAQPPGLARALADKHALARLCADHGVPTPRVDAIADAAHLRALADEVAFPVVVKSIDGARAFRRTGERMRIVADRAALLRAYEELEDPEVPNLLLQEYIPGGPESVWMLNAYFDAASEGHVAVTGRKVRQLPPDTGVTTLGVCQPNPAVEQMTRRLMKRLGYRGVLDIGFRFDRRDGRHKLLDVNPRVGATFRLFAGTNGVDVVRALYLDFTGQPIPPTSPQWGRKWLVENFDVSAAVRYCCAGRLTPRRWLGSVRGVAEAGWYAHDDLAPFGRMCGAYLASAPRRLAMRVGDGAS